MDFLDAALCNIDGTAGHVAITSAGWIGANSVGFEGGGMVGSIFKKIVGETGPKVTAVLSNAPGGLQLLPSERKGLRLFTLDAVARSTLKMQLSKLLAILLIWQISGIAYACEKSQDRSAPVERVRYQESKIECNGFSYALKFDKKNARATLVFKGLSQVVDDVPRNQNPILVDSAQWVRLLPLEKQPYLVNGIVALTLARKSKAASSGQCGSGREIDLVFFDVHKSKLKRLSSYVLESCLDSLNIALDGVKLLDAISIENDELIGEYDYFHGAQGVRRKFTP
jgi:hypothetical protein